MSVRQKFRLLYVYVLWYITELKLRLRCDDWYYLFLLSLPKSTRKRKRFIIIIWVQRPHDRFLVRKLLLAYTTYLPKKIWCLKSLGRVGTERLWHSFSVRPGLIFIIRKLYTYRYIHYDFKEKVTCLKIIQYTRLQYSVVIQIFTYLEGSQQCERHWGGALWSELSFYVTSRTIVKSVEEKSTCMCKALLIQRVRGKSLPALPGNVTATTFSFEQKITLCDIIIRFLW